jgi:hypothetical protein
MKSEDGSCEGEIRPTAQRGLTDETRTALVTRQTALSGRTDKIRHKKNLGCPRFLLTNTHGVTWLLSKSKQSPPVSENILTF